MTFASLTSRSKASVSNTNHHGAYRQNQGRTSHTGRPSHRLLTSHHISRPTVGGTSATSNALVLIALVVAIYVLASYSLFQLQTSVSLISDKTIHSPSLPVLKIQPIEAPVPARQQQRQQSVIAQPHKQASQSLPQILRRSPDAKDERLLERSDTIVTDAAIPGPDVPQRNIVSEPIVQIEFSTEADFLEHRKAAEAAVKLDAFVLRKVITAYIEPPLRDTIPNTGNRGDPQNDKDFGTPPDFVVPLPRRTHTPRDLLKIEYPNSARTCNDMPGKFPIDRGLEINAASGEAVVWNVDSTPTPPDFAEKEAPFCPVELDPFLPWIHDVFPSQDGSRIEFIAQNKRRCRTGALYTENVNRLVPQVALMQSVSVEKVTDARARKLAPDLWHPDDDGTTTTPRYRLAPYDEASPDGGMYTRFICRFHMATMVDNDDGTVAASVVLGETLSEFPFNYELVSYRKLQRSLLSPMGKDTRLFWASNLHFSCPLPATNDALRKAVATGTTVLTDGTPTVYVDLVPIRTSVRYEELHLTEDMIGPKDEWDLPAFDAETRWGARNVLPRVEASGRWTNIPICLPPELVDAETFHTETDLDTFETTEVTRKLVPNVAELPKKPHFLSACLWASAEFKTRGNNRGGDTETMNRLPEWIEFQLMVGFDHIYVYDNSGAHTSKTSLKPVVDMYPGKVTHIDWPSTVCNNNIPAHDSTGERSSQYAAENSCRRYVRCLQAHP